MEIDNKDKDNIFTNNNNNIDLIMIDNNLN